jgi:CO/xanthine dehydrogenase FAD-binding subunit
MTVLVPKTLVEALDAAGRNPDAHLLAGGTDLMVEVNMGHRRPTTVIAIGHLAELTNVTHDAAASIVRIGAAVPYRTIERGPVAALVPALAEAARTVGSPQIRNAGTLGGNLGTCSPAGDTLPVLAALEATVELVSEAGVRTLPVGAFMTGVKRNDRQPGEIIAAINVPVLDGWQGYAKVGTRNAMVIAMVSACLAVDQPSRSVRIALGAAAPTALRVSDAEAFIAGAIDWSTGTVTASDVDRFVTLVRAAARPIDDHRSSAEYRRQAAGVLAGRLLRRAFPA